MPPETETERVAETLSAAEEEWSRTSDRAELLRVLLALLLDLDND